MSYSSAEIPADELALFAANKPIIGNNMISDTPTCARWTAAPGYVSSTDITHTTEGMAIRAYDGLANLATKCNTAAETILYYVLQFSSPIEFDFLGILGNNFASCLPTAVSVEIANNANFTTNLIELTSWSAPTTNNRLIDWAIYHTGATAMRYSNVEYLRVKFTKGSGFTPQFNELIVGRRRQLRYKPDAPFDKYAYRANRKGLVTEGGVRSKHEYYSGQYELSAKYYIDNTTDQSDLVTWYTTNYGLKPFIWCLDPTTYPNNWYFLDPPDDFDFPQTGVLGREIEILGIEQGSESYFLAKQ